MKLDFVASNTVPEEVLRSKGEVEFEFNIIRPFSIFEVWLALDRKVSVGWGLGLKFIGDKGFENIVVFQNFGLEFSKIGELIFIGGHLRRKNYLKYIYLLIDLFFS